MGIGAQRSGTSWWHSLLEAHPGVHALGWPFKELHFFDRFASDSFTDDDVQAYHEYFRAPPGRIAGEWTPRYMYDPTTPPLLHRAAPQARLLVLLRDPVARLRSGYAHAVARGVAPEPAWVDALARGLYAQQLETVLASYPRAQLLVLQFERCVAAPADELARTYAFLGLRPFTPRNLARPVNRGGAAPPLPPERDAQIRAAYAPDVRSLSASFDDIDLSLWPDTARLLGA
ncbi:MAG TPA: sulfotransferase [Acidimicrobiales bacterium]|nr:sulfotransferase [Acidimicrobiales bacterium]